MNEETKELLRKQRYQLVGEHSAVKLCHWLKESIMRDRVCYKQKFYGIKSHRCLQMTPAVNWCTQKCLFCWRPTRFTEDVPKEVDAPKFIIEKSIEAQRTLLSGYQGVLDQLNRKKLEEAQDPNNVAISLSGEPTCYPLLPELLEEFERGGFTTFLVTNGTNPDIFREMGTLPWNLYLTIPAPNEKIYERLCNPSISDGWDRINRTIDIFPSLDTRKVMRLTMTKGFNMCDPESYAKIIERGQPTYVEVKAYMYVGFSRQRLSIDNMPRHEEIRAFAESISEHCSYSVVNESEDSRVVLLSAK
ncbi:MAG: 4-demethylwyosine synthase TYW1 [Candidatus Methanofastidiosa archaeon]|nr:4-demethylwyosine synthase TYW1 [Candidatus Methanofastidiosa archaeon]